MSKLTIAGFDPGKNNFSFSIVQIDVRTGKKFKVVTTGMVEHTITDITTNLDVQAKRFKKEIQSILRGYQVDAFIAERYMVRGMFMGASAEVINLMLGTLITLNVDKRLITAAQWKNAFNKVYDLKEFYTEVPLVAHRVDAGLIGLYGASLLLDTKPYACLSNNVNKIRKQLADTDK